jgi:hypothetical protein
MVSTFGRVSKEKYMDIGFIKLNFFTEHTVFFGDVGNVAGLLW